MNFMYFRFKKVRFQMAVLLPIMLLGCTDKKADAPLVDAPFVLDLVALPNEVTIGDAYFYPKPFSVRAKYSDNTEKNISSRVTWRSENNALIRINKKGEIEKTGECELIKCMVSLIATDPESGKSLRFTVNISQKKTSKFKEKTTGNTDVETLEDGLEGNKEPQDVADANENHNEYDDKALKPSSALSDFSSLSVGSDIGTGNDEEVVDRIILNDLSEIDVKIDSVFFDEQRISLVSGDEYTPHVMSIDTVGEKRLMRGRYECYSLDDLNPSVMVISPCQLIAVRPGEIEIGVRLVGESSILTNSQILEVDVSPRKILSTREGGEYSLEMSSDNIQKWLTVSGLQVMDYYRVQLTGNLSYGQRISVYENSEGSFQVCMNTALLGLKSIACYFQALSNSTRLAVDNPGRESSSAMLTITRVDPRLFNNSEKQSSKTPAEIALNDPVSDFIVANETGLNSHHFYELPASSLSNTDLLVTLSNYEADIQLGVTGQVCRDVKRVQNKALKSCQISNYDGSKLLITINGNSDDFNQLSKSTAEQGGTFYKLLLDKVE